VDLSKDELFLRIRRDSGQEGLSMRALARKYGVHRRLVREALASPSPKPRKTPVRQSPRLEPFSAQADQWCPLPWSSGLSAGAFTAPIPPHASHSTVCPSTVTVPAPRQFVHVAKACLPHLREPDGQSHQQLAPQLEFGELH
jgi:hypothetical protein